jgi:hypothetical protein
MLVRRHQENGAAVLALLADAPGAPETVAVILDRIALQAPHRHDRDLTLGGALELGQRLGEPGAGRRRQDAGLVDDDAGERREFRLIGMGAGAGQGREQKRRSRDSGRSQPTTHHQNRTFGGSCASAEMVKVSFTLASG